MLLLGNVHHSQNPGDLYGLDMITGHPVEGFFVVIALCTLPSARLVAIYNTVSNVCQWFENLKSISVLNPTCIQMVSHKLHL